MKSTVSMAGLACLALALAMAAPQAASAGKAGARGDDGRERERRRRGRAARNLPGRAAARQAGRPAAGAHAFHVHTIGACEPPFKSAGGHYNPTGAQHGMDNPEGMHAGDMPNIHVGASGALEIEVLNTMLRLDDALFDADGAAIVIHAGPDDYKTDPAGARRPAHRLRRYRAVVRAARPRIRPSGAFSFLISSFRGATLAAWPRTGTGWRRGRRGRARGAARSPTRPAGSRRRSGSRRSTAGPAATAPARTGRRSAPR